ncbi:MAG TPA: adenylate/guanylate cyclase domain-containing protein, partial [bacterium]|nr:adenylate/guanylate cyclase domain-containing protein [bacterium]
RLAEGVVSLINAQIAATLLMTDGDSAEWPVFAAANGRSAVTTGWKLAENHPLIWSAREKSALVIHSAADDPRLKKTGTDIPPKPMIITPVESGGVVYGALSAAGSNRSESFTDNDVSVSQLMAGIAASVIHNIRQERSKEFEKLREEQMRDLFSRFVSSSVAEHILQNPDLLKGRWQEVTILVSDIRDFTRISEKMTPEQILEQLNEYFTEIVNVIFEHQGTVDKFIGDCIVAYWGAPAHDAEHAEHAARAAAAMSEKLEKLCEKWIEEGRPVFRSGIGLHTCNVLIGNIGDERKREFTILGEEVEKAMEIESLTKEYNTKIILSEQTAKTMIRLEKLPDRENGALGGLYELKGLDK